MKHGNKLSLAALLAAVSLAAPSLAADSASGKLYVATDAGVYNTAGAQGRDAAGEQNGLIGLLHTSSAQFPTDQRNSVNGDGAADVVTQSGPKGGALAAAGSVKGSGNTSIQPFQPGFTGGVNVAVGDVNGDGRADIVTQSGNRGPAKLGSLSGLGSMDQLFANSRGGDGGTGLLLPAVQKVRDAAARSSASASVPDAPEQKSLNFTNPGAVKGLNFANVAPGGGAGNSLEARGLNFANQGGSAGQAGAGAGPHVKVFNGAAANGTSNAQINPGAAKGLNFATTVRK